jgi:hypothetical protein
MKTTQTLQGDPFLTDIDRMISEEQFICESQPSSDANKRLIDQLKQFKMKYEEHLNTMKLGREVWTLSKIYDLIKLLKEITTVRIQLDAITQYQQRLVKNKERVVDGDGAH